MAVGKIEMNRVDLIYFEKENIGFIYTTIDIRKEKTNEAKRRKSQMKLKLKS